MFSISASWGYYEWIDEVSLVKMSPNSTLFGLFLIIRNTLCAVSCGTSETGEILWLKISRNGRITFSLSRKMTLEINPVWHFPLCPLWLFLYTIKCQVLFSIRIIVRTMDINYQFLPHKRCFLHGKRVMETHLHEKSHGMALWGDFFELISKQC